MLKERSRTSLKEPPHGRRAATNEYEYNCDSQLDEVLHPATEKDQKQNFQLTKTSVRMFDDILKTKGGVLKDKMVKEQNLAMHKISQD